MIFLIPMTILMSLLNLGCRGASFAFLMLIDYCIFGSAVQLCKAVDGVVGLYSFRILSMYGWEFRACPKP